jgi:hypothetical protein
MRASSSNWSCRNLGVGSQFALSIPGQDRRRPPPGFVHLLTDFTGCTSIDQIPISASCTSCASPLLHVPSRDTPLISSDPLVTSVLDYHAWLCASGPDVGNITPVISHLPRRLLRTSTPASVKVWPLSLPCNLNKSQSRRSSRSTRWQVW